MIVKCDGFVGRRDRCQAYCDTEDIDSTFGWIKVDWNDNNGDGVAHYNFHDIHCLIRHIDTRDYY